MSLTPKKSHPELLQNILDTIPDAILISNANGVIAYSCKGAETLLQSENLVGKHVEDFIPLTFRKKHSELRTEYVRNPTTRSMGNPLNLKIVRGDGCEIPVDILLTPIDWDGEQHFLTVIRNIEHIKKLQMDLTENAKLLDQTLLKLQQTDAEKNKLLGMAAHDLRSPITAIYSLAQLVLEENSVDPETIVLIRRIFDLSRFMLTLVNDVLDFSNIESGTMKLTLAMTNLSEVLEGGLIMWRPSAHHKNIEIKTEVENNLPPTAVDKNKIIQVMDNLITNAIKFSPPNSTITLSLLTSPEGKIIFKVMDQGPGISEKGLSSLFHPFSKIGTKATGGEKSTGLGLAIVRKVIEAHQGKIWVESELGKGSTFFVEFQNQSS